MESYEKKAVVEAFKNHDVWNVPFVQEVEHRLHIDTNNLQNLRVCDNLAIDKPEYIYLVDQYKNIPTNDLDNAVFCYKNNKDTNEVLHYFHIVPKHYGILISKWYPFLEHMIRFAHINVVTNSDD